jgi:signal transduction histidine kinase
MTRGWFLSALAGIGMVFGSAAVTMVVRFPASASAVSEIVYAAVGGVWIAAGLVAWARRPELRIGRLMSAVGFTWLASKAWWPAPLPYTVHYVLSGLTLAVGLHAILAFPTGTLVGRPTRALVVSGYATVLVGNVALLMFWVPAAQPCSGCVRNLLLVDGNGHVADAITTGTTVISIGLSLVAVVLFVRRWGKASVAGRHVLGPVIWSSVLATAAVILQDVLDGFAGPPAWLSHVLGDGVSLTLALVPLAFLVGLLRVRLRRGAMTGLMVELGGLPAPDGVRVALARALGDPSLRLVFWQPASGGYIDTNGRPVALPADDQSNAVTMLEHGGERFGALVHDPFMLEDSTMLEAVGAAARLALENARLQAELRAQLARVRASRARIVEAGDAVRRRIERDLHDGAQQRLLAIRLALGLIRGRVGRDDAEVQALLTEADEELIAGLEELRSLARGIHPAVLTDEGLSAALAALARRSPVPVELRTAPAERLPEPLEAAMYFVASEALVNVAKHAHASYATLTVARTNGRVSLEVSDDGIGGASPSAGSGLSGLSDRVEALDGRLRVSSDADVGTTVLAEFPLPHPAALRPSS